MADTDEITRPDWVPPHATWANGLWHVNGVKIFNEPARREMTDRERGLAKKAENDAEYDRQHKVLTEGLEPGEYRHGGMVYAKGKPIRPDDQSWRPGYAEARDKRLTDIKAAAAEEHRAIAALEKATERRHIAAARRSQASDVLVDV